MRTCEDGCNGCDECTDYGDEPCVRGCKPWECRAGWPDALTLKPDMMALKKRLAEDPGFAAEVTGDRPRAKLNDEAPSNAAHWHKVAME